MLLLPVQGCQRTPPATLALVRTLAITASHLKKWHASCTSSCYHAYGANHRWCPTPKLERAPPPPNEGETIVLWYVIQLLRIEIYCKALTASWQNHDPNCHHDHKKIEVADPARGCKQLEHRSSPSCAGPKCASQRPKASRHPRTRWFLIPHFHHALDLDATSKSLKWKRYLTRLIIHTCGVGTMLPITATQHFLQSHSLMSNKHVLMRLQRALNEHPFPHA